MQFTTPPTSRLPDWEARLDAALMAARANAFEWGRHDCVQFAATIVETITGWDALADCPDYASEDEAAALLEKMKWGGIHRGLYKALGHPIPLAQAQRGDVVFAELGGENTPYLEESTAAGICIGRWAVFVSSDFGLFRLALSECRWAWKVGR